MTWISSIAIGGAILAAGPIIIHILFRRRYRVVKFAAFQFLMESRKRTRQRIRIEELILILLRVLACALVGLMLSDIRLSAAGGGSGEPTAHVFVLDDSLSMGQQAGTATLYKKAVAHIARRIEAMGAGDSVAILSASRPRSGQPLGRLVPAPEAKTGPFVARFNASKPTDMRADVPGALKAAAGVIAGVGGKPVRLYICSDFRKPDFAGQEQTDALRAAIEGFDAKTVQIVLLDFGLPCRNNLAIENISAGRNVVVAGLSTPVRVLIRNAGSEPSPATRLQVTVGDAALPVQPVPPLAPRETALVEFTSTFPVPGSASVRVSLPPDDLPADSASSLAIAVQESLRILVLDGSPNPSDPNSASFALAHALDPSGKGSFGRRVDVQSLEAWKPAPLGTYDTVIMVNVREFPVSRDADGKPVYPGLQALEDFVKSGGGLAIFAGDRISADFYNGPMYSNGNGLSPLEISANPVPAIDPKKFLRLNAESVADEPMLRIFSSRGANFSQFLRFYAHIAANRPAKEVGAPTVLAAFDNGSPAVCRRSYGKGTVIMWYSSADTKWSNWPKDLSFVPVMNDMAWELARQAENLFDDFVGRTVGYTLPAKLSSALSASLKTPQYPAEDVHALSLDSNARERTVSYPEPAHAGIYELTLLLADRSEHRVLFSRHTDPRESEYARVPESDLRAAVGRPCVYTPDLAVRADAKDGEAPIKSRWWIFLAFLVAVLALENALALRFGHYQSHAGGAAEAAR